MNNDSPPQTEGLINVDIGDNNPFLYSTEDTAMLQRIANEAGNLFPTGAEFTSPAELKDLARSFANKNGFAVSADGFSFLCSRIDERAG